MWHIHAKGDHSVFRPTEYGHICSTAHCACSNSRSIKCEHSEVHSSIWVFFFFALWPDGDLSPRLALSPKARDSLCLMSRGLRLRTPTEKSSEPQRPFTAITDYCVRWKQGMDLAGERQTYQRQPFSLRVHYLAFRFLSISFLLARADGARPAQAALWCRPPFRLCFPAPSLPCLLLHIPPPFTSNLSPPQFVILSLCLSGSPPPSSYLGTTTALCCHDSEGNVEARDQPTCF